MDITCAYCHTVFSPDEWRQLPFAGSNTVDGVVGEYRYCSGIIHMDLCNTILYAPIMDMRDGAL